MNYGELIMDTEHVLCYGSHMFRQFVYCSCHCSAVAQLLAVQSTVNTQKGAIYHLSAQKKGLEKDKPQKGSIEKLKKRIIYVGLQKEAI